MNDMYTYVYHLDVLTRRLRSLLPVFAVEDGSPRKQTPLFMNSTLPRHSRTHLSLSSLMVVMTTLLGWMPMGTVAPFDLSR